MFQEAKTLGTCTDIRNKTNFSDNVMVWRNDLGRPGEQVLSREWSDKHNPQLHSGWSKRLRRNSTQVITYQGKGKENWTFILARLCTGYVWDSETYPALKIAKYQIWKALRPKLNLANNQLKPVVPIQTLTAFRHWHKTSTASLSSPGAEM